jgi:hypothetical protein
MTVTAAAAAAIGIAVLAFSGSRTASLDGSRDTRGARGSCLALMMPAVQGVPGNAEGAASGVRDLLAKYLTGPSLKVVILESPLESQAVLEAKKKPARPSSSCMPRGDRDAQDG